MFDIGLKYSSLRDSYIKTYISHLGKVFDETNQFAIETALQAWKYKENQRLQTESCKTITRCDWTIVIKPLMIPLLFEPHHTHQTHCHTLTAVQPQEKGGVALFIVYKSDIANLNC